jgi:glycosyltransferase involved in cell wall biosynthesis
MAKVSDPRLVMLGPAAQTHGEVASIVELYRAQGLFKRWPVEYLATHGDGGVGRDASLVLDALRRFVGLIWQERRVVVHMHVQARRGFWRDALFMALTLATRNPLILQLHGAGFERLSESAGAPGRLLLRWLLERAAYVVVPCEPLRAWVGSISRSSNVVCIPNPVAPGKPVEDRRPNLVLFMAELQSANGVFDLLDAVAALRAAVPDVRLVCAGEGQRSAVRRHAQHLGIADAVTFTGWVGPSGRRALLESAAVFALPAYAGALPMSLLEAMAASVPAVVSPVGAVPEVVTDGVTGLLVAPGDRASLQRALRKLLLDRALGARIGAAARESVGLRFDPERAVPRLEGVYAAVGVCALAVTPGRFATPA